MFAALGKFVVRARWWVIAAWIVTAVVIAVTAPALQSTQDQSEFLPGHYESVKALTVQQEAFPERGEIGAIVVFDREDGSELTQDDQAEVSSIAEQLNTKSYDNLGTAVANPVSENGLIAVANEGVEHVGHRGRRPRNHDGVLRRARTQAAGRGRLGGEARDRSLVGCCDLRICGGVTGVAAVTGVTYGLGWEVSKLPPEPEVTPVCHLLRHLLPRPARAATSGCFRCWSRCPTRVIGAGCATRWPGCWPWRPPR